MRWGICAVAVAGVALAGCGEKSVLSGEGKANAIANKEAGRTASGLWVGKYQIAIQPPKTDKGNDPAAGFGQAMVSMFAQMFKLQILDDSHFKLMGMISGDYVVSNSKVTLTPKTLFGMSFNDLKSKHPELLKGKESDVKPMEGSISDDGKTITIASNKLPESAALSAKGGEPDIQFTLLPPRKIGPSSVTEEEKPIVGSYHADTTRSNFGKFASNPMMDGPKLDADMLTAVGRTFTLNLDADNSFELSMAMFDIDGKWSKSANVVVLKGDSFMGQGLSATLGADGAIAVSMGQTSDPVVFVRD